MSLNSLYLLTICDKQFSYQDNDNYRNFQCVNLHIHLQCISFLHLVIYILKFFSSMFIAFLKIILEIIKFCQNASRIEFFLFYEFQSTYSDEENEENQLLLHNWKCVMFFNLFSHPSVMSNMCILDHQTMLSTSTIWSFICFYLFFFLQSPRPTLSCSL